MGYDRREFLRYSAAGVASLALGGTARAVDKVNPNQKPATPAGFPPKNPYDHANTVAKLPPWDGSTTSASVAGSMRMFRGNLAHDYYGSGKVSEAPRLAWKFRMWDFSTQKHGEPVVWKGTGWTGQALHHAGYVWVGSTGGHFHCFDAATGALVWVYTAERMFKGSPTLWNNRIYVPNVDNHLRCLDAATGAVVWDWTGPNDLDSSPRIVDSMLYVGGEDGRLKCFDPETGKLLWHEDFGVGAGEKPGSGGIESSLAIVDHVAYFGHLDGFVRAYSLKERKLLWKTKLGKDIDASALVIGDRLYVGVEEGKPSFHCLDRHTGAKVWAKDIPEGVWSTPARSGKNVMVGGNDGKLYCFDAASGAETWVFDAGAGIWASPSCVDGKVMFGAYDNWYRMVDSATGKLIWKYDIGDRSHSGCAIENGRIFVGGSSGYFYCFAA